ncbi:CU044_2847 family protein [Streptomyces sp. NPDC090127]|uniref:CU044_2847 family protein n=1 Tax=Streptomyces sp. NPDC090127 TaxID=3365953 RepID=UPI00382CB8B2
MRDITRVEVQDAVLYVEAERFGSGSDLEGMDDLEGLGGHVPDLSGVTRALSTFAGQLGQALRQAAPDRATVEFGCELGLDAGGLTALIVKGSSRANLRVTLEWTRSS